MPNQLAKDLELMFGEYVEGYDAGCVVSREVRTSYPSPTTMQRSGDVFYKPQNYMASVVQGLDISASASTDIVQRFVPTVYRTPDNVKWQMDAKEMRDPEHRKEVGKAAALRLSAEIDKNLYDTVRAQGAIVIKKVGAMSWETGQDAEATLISRGVANGRLRKLFMNAFDYKDVAKDLGNRAYLGQASMDAYERSIVPDIAMFRTFRTDNQSVLPAVGVVTGTTVNGTQSFTPSAMTGDVPTDNRRMTLSVAGANIANIKNGDAFTIANVNAVHQIDKSDTGQPMTVRVISGAGTASLVVTPALIATGPYQNVTAAAIGGAAITFLNTVSKAVNPFFCDGALMLDYGKLAFPAGEGAQVMTATTKNGVPLIMSYQFDHLTGVTTCRFTTMYAVTMLDPEAGGIIIANQT
jgi:hypothetical protein